MYPPEITLVTATVRRLLLSTGDAAHLGAKATSRGERMTRIWADWAPTTRISP